MKTIQVIGNVGQDPKTEVDTKTGKKKCQISVGAGNGKNEDGTYKPSDWFYCTFWEKAAETIEKYVKKGHRICVHGELQISTWQRRDTGVTETSLYINNPRFELIGGAEKSEPAKTVAAVGAAPAQKAFAAQDGDPF